MAFSQTSQIPNSPLSIFPQGPFHLFQGSGLPFQQDAEHFGGVIGGRMVRTVARRAVQARVRKFLGVTLDRGGQFLPPFQQRLAILLQGVLGFFALSSWVCLSFTFAFVAIQASFPQNSGTLPRFVRTVLAKF